MVSRDQQYGKKAILDSYVYRFNRRYETLDGYRYRWMCSHNGCFVSVLADQDGSIKKEPRLHLHDPPDAASREADIAVGKIKKLAKETTSKTSEVVDEVRNKVLISVLGQMPSKQALLQKVQRSSRNEELKAPANPTDFDNLIILHKFAFHQKRDSMGGTDLVEERWLQSEIQIRGKKILIFGRKKFMNLLEDTDDWLGDGTFKSAPAPFAQVFIVHAKWRDTHRVVPCFYALLPDKFEITYIMMLLEYGIQILVDNDPAISLQARMLRGLAFIPEEEVVAAYEELLLNIDIQIWNGFLSNYFEVYYVGEPHRFGPGRNDGVFPRATWNVHHRTLNGDMRTNNTLEGFNHRVNLCMQEMHPTLWKFIEKLKKLDESVYSDYLQWLDGKEPTTSKRRLQMERPKLSKCFQD